MTVGPRIQSSPGSPSFASDPSSATSLASRFGRSSPALPILSSARFKGSKVHVGLVSVKPYPCVTSTSAPRPRRRFCTRAVSSGPSGAAPEKKNRILDKSYLSTAEWEASWTRTGGTMREAVILYFSIKEQNSSGLKGGEITTGIPRVSFKKVIASQRRWQTCVSVLTGY